ncbi:MAG: GNAT family N-acetyltransferase [Anaerolineaceae bacterium]|nr:GNAT family N-acetyltransferase [Anaerolineaceae bacterium]
MEKNKILSESLLIIDPKDERWLEYIQRNCHSNIFHHPYWLQLLTECYGFKAFICAVMGKTDNIIAGLPVMEINSRFSGQRWVSLPFSDYCLPLYDDLESFNKIIDFLINPLKVNHLPVIELRWAFPKRPEIYPYSEYVLHKVNLSPDKKEVFGRIKTKYRRLTRKAEEKGITVKCGNSEEQLDAFYSLHLKTRHRIGVPIQPRKFFNLLREYLLKRDLGFIVLTYKGTEALEAAIFLHWQKTLTYKFSASSGMERNLSPIDPLMSLAINWGCENYFDELDLGRTDYSNIGLRFFKNRWGAVEIPLVYSMIGHPNKKNPSDLIYPLAQKVIKSSPEWVCKLAGEMLYKYYG